MTINGPAAILLAFYIAVAERQGVTARPPGHAAKRHSEGDTCPERLYLSAWAQREVGGRSVRVLHGALPQWNTVCISGYHIREAGSTAAEEVAFTLADGTAYVQACQERGLDVDRFAPRLSFFFDVHNDFFEEIAKMRASSEGSGLD